MEAVQLVILYRTILRHVLYHMAQAIMLVQVSEKLAVLRFLREGLSEYCESVERGKTHIKRET
jgi:hypothetical protein